MQNQILNITDGADQCCDGEAYNPTPSICCDGNLLNRATTGDTCCGGDAFFERKGKTIVFSLAPFLSFYHKNEIEGP